MTTFNGAQAQVLGNGVKDMFGRVEIQAEGGERTWVHPSNLITQEGAPLEVLGIRTEAALWTEYRCPSCTKASIDAGNLDGLELRCRHCGAWLQLRTE